MAALEKIRSKAGLLIFVIAFALLCFIVGDFLNNSTTIFREDPNLVGNVNGEKITRSDIDVACKQMEFMGAKNPDEAINRVNAFQNLKMKNLIASEAANDGISVSTAELTDATIGDHPHPVLMQSGIFNQEGRFDKSLVSRFFSSLSLDVRSVPRERQEEFREQQARNKMVWKYLEQNIRTNMLADKLGTVLTNAMATPEAEIEFMKKVSANEFDAIVCRKFVSDIEDKDVTVNADDFKNYYEKYKNVRFKAAEDYRELKLILYPIKPSEKDLADGRNNMDSLRVRLQKTEDKKDLALLFTSTSERNYPFIDVFVKTTNYESSFVDFAKNGKKNDVSEVVTDNQAMLYKVAKISENPQMRPDSVRISAIIFADPDSAKAANRADSVLNAIKGGADFAQLANTLSADKSHVGGDYGWIMEGGVEFNDQAFTSPVGTVFTHKTQNGSFVVKVTDKTAPVLKAKMHILATRIEPSAETIDSLQNAANDFIRENKTAELFEQTIKDKHLRHMPVRVMKSVPMAQPISNSSALVKWAFEHVKGDVTAEPFENKEYFIIGALTNVVEAKNGYAPFESVTIDSSSVRVEKKAEKLIETMKGKDLAELGNVDTIKDIRLASNYISKLGNEPALVGAVVAAKADVLSQPVRGNSGVMVFKKVAERPSQVGAVEKANLDMMVRQSVQSSFVKALESHAQVEDGSFNLY